MSLETYLLSQGEQELCESPPDFNLGSVGHLQRLQVRITDYSAGKEAKTGLLICVLDRSCGSDEDT